MENASLDFSGAFTLAGFRRVKYEQKNEYDFEWIVLVETDASNKQAELVKKLTAAWEKKIQNCTRRWRVVDGPYTCSLWR